MKSFNQNLSVSVALICMLLFTTLNAQDLSERIVEGSANHVITNFQAPASKDSYDLQFAVDFSSTGLISYAGAECDGVNLYASVWNSGDISVFTVTGTFVETFSIPSVTGTRDMAFDGTYFYGGAAASTLFQMDFASQTLVSSISTGVSGICAIAYDEYDGFFYANNWADDITLFDISGAVMNIIPYPETTGGSSTYGMAYDNISDGGPFLWLTQSDEAGDVWLSKMNLASGALTDEIMNVSTTVGGATNASYGGLWIEQTEAFPSTYTIGGILQGDIYMAYGYELTSEGIALTNDVQVAGFASPTSGMALGVEEVIVVIKNNGTAAQTAIPFEVTVNGAVFYTGTTTQTLAMGETEEINCGTVDMSQGGTWTLEGCTSLVGDEDPENDCSTMSVWGPLVCDPITNLDVAVGGYEAYLTWNAPGGGLTEGFETSVPPADWTAVVTNTTETWVQVGTVSLSVGDIVPPEGSFQAQVFWDYGAQDEWLITPTFEAGSELKFYSYSGAFGSTNGDHYYAKISTDGGVSWTELWDAVTGSTPDVYEEITVDLSAYSGDIQLAWQAVDVDGQGLWFAWFIDDIRVVSGKGDIISFDGQLHSRLASTKVETISINGLNRDGSEMVISYAKDAINFYEIYRNGSSVGTTDETFYTNDIPGAGTYEYCVEAVYTSGCIADQVCVTLSGGFEIPTDLWVVSETPNSTGGEDVLLNWSHSECGGGGVAEWIGYDDGSNTDGIGGSETFYVAARWDASDISAYDGYAITKMAIYPYAVGSTGTAQINLMVWSGANAANVQMDEAISGYTSGEWNEFDLATPPAIDGSQELWIGYFVASDGASYPAGTDAGPAVAGYGDMISLDGATWESMATSYGLDYNWNIQVCVESGKSGSTVILGKTNLISSTTTPVSQGEKVAGAKFVPKGFVTFVLFDDDGAEVGTTTDCEYLDVIPMGLLKCYTVIARYDGGDSDPCINIDCTTDVRGLDANALNIYPNPASTSLFIESGNQIDRVTIYNMVGQLVYDRQVSETGVVKLNLSTYGTGVYLVKVQVAGEITVKRITVAN